MMNVPSFGAYYKAGAMLNLKEYVKKVIIDFSKYPKALVDVYTEPNGNVWGISKAFDAIGLFYNKALFDKAKVEYPNDTWTWDDLRSAAKKLTSDGVWGFTVSPENQDGYYNFLVQNGGGIISDDKKKSLFDKPESIEAIQFLYDLIFVDKVSPDRNKLIETEYTTLFQGERTAMATMGCWMVESCYDALGEKLGVAPLPKGKVNGNSIIHGEAWCISSKSKYPDQAWEVLKFFESDESNNIAADIGYILPSKAGFQQKWVESVPGVNKQLFVDAAQKAGSTYPFSIETSKWQEVEGKYIADIFAGIITPEEGCKKIADEMNQILANEK